MSSVSKFSTCFKNFSTLIQMTQLSKFLMMTIIIFDDDEHCIKIFHSWSDGISSYILYYVYTSNIVLWKYRYFVIITIDKHIRYHLRPSYRCYGTNSIIPFCVIFLLALLNVIKSFLLILKKDKENFLLSAPTDRWIFSCFSGYPTI